METLGLYGAQATLAQITQDYLGVSAQVWDILLKFVIAFASMGIVMSLAGVSVVAERKICAYIQGRYGPNRTAVPLVAAIPFAGRWLQRSGLMQLLADALKFLFKEDPLPKHVSKWWFLAAPVMSLAPILIVTGLVPFGVYWIDGIAYPVAAADLDVSLLAALAISALGVFGTIMAGWSSNSKFPYVGAMRGAAQVVSYEIAMGLSALSLVLWVAPSVDSPLSLFEIGKAQSGMWFLFTQPLAAFIFLIALFAETNRLPFDMAESETDLVSGYHTEYGSFKFGLFYTGEYGHIVVGSALYATLFLGAWNPLPGVEWPEAWGWISVLLSVVTVFAKVAAMVVFFIWVRWSIPRFRYDQLMKLGWKVLVPLATLNIVFYMLLSLI